MPDLVRWRLAGVFDESGRLWDQSGTEVSQAGVSDKYIGPQLSFGGFSAMPQHEIGDNPQANGGNRQNKSEESDGIARSPLPDGFALFCFAAACFGGVVTFLLLSIGKRV
jgi:hypothetical protein